MSGIQREAGLIESMLAEGAYIATTRGRSMIPMLRTGKDVVKLVKPTAALKKYDVVLYRLQSGKYILHRVIAVRGDILVIRGDNTYKKEYVERDDILAVLTEFKRNGKKHSVTERGYLLYARLWRFIYPVRFLAHTALRLAARLYRKIFPHNRAS